MRAAIQSSGDAGAPVTILATGPLTNVALLLLTSPELASPRYIREIVLMGGAVGVGNTGPAAEFNIQVDPESAHIVFESGLAVVMVPLEVTHTALVTPAVLGRIRAIGTPFASFICDLMLYFRDAYRTVFGFSSPPLHDPCAVAYLLAPGMFETHLMRVDIDYESRLCYGRTVCDIYGRDVRAKNVRVCLRMDVEKFWGLVLDALRQADQRSCLNQPQDGQALYASKTEAEDAAAAAAAAAVPGQVAVETAGPRAVVLQNLPPRADSA
jgi:inosine-uridine nucleoside N-ribohydrolase